MKMDKLVFARLVAKIQYLVNQGREIDGNDICHINELVTDVVAGRFTTELLTEMMVAMNAGRKIEAIKAHRLMTGWALKESKDWVEANWFCQPRQEV